MSRHLYRWTSIFCLCVIAAAAHSDNVRPIQVRPKQVAGVDNSRMGAYRSLAELAFQSFQRNDLATAAKLGRILERTWDAAEEGGGPKSLEAVNKLLFEQIDESMDQFIRPLKTYLVKAPNAALVAVAYTAYLDKLKRADVE